jgi:hypothetical protein
MLSNSEKSLANGEPQEVCRDLFDSTTKQYGSVPNIALMSGDGDALKIRSSSPISSPQLVSADSAKQDAAKGAEFTRPPKRPWSSMPNIHITFSETEAIESECVSVEVAVVEVENGTEPADDVHVYSDPITNTSHGATTERRRRRSWWKRTKKFVRRMFCCA